MKMIVKPKNITINEKVVERDFKGNLLSETLGSLQQHADGTWWIA